MSFKTLDWIRQHKFKTGLITLLAGFLALNAMAYRHAYTMTHYGPPRPRGLRRRKLSGMQKIGLLFSGIQIPRPTNRKTPASEGLAYTTHRFNTRDGEELEAWLVACPQAKGLVLMFHGYAGAKSRMLKQALLLHRMGYATLLVDFRGSGGSSGSATSLGVWEALDVVAADKLGRLLRPGLRRVYFGQSMGAVALMRAAATEDIRPQAAILEFPFSTMLGTVENRCRLMGLPRWPAAKLLVFWGGVQHGFDGFQHNPVDYARRLVCPTLLLYGDMDRRVQREDTDAVMASLGGPKQLTVFEGLGHRSAAKLRPAAWQAVVGSFLQGLKR